MNYDPSYKPAAPQQIPGAGNYHAPVQPPQPPKKNSGSPVTVVLIIIVVILALIVAVLAGILLISMNKGSDGGNGGKRDDSFVRPTTQYELDAAVTTEAAPGDSIQTTSAAVTTVPQTTTAEVKPTEAPDFIGEGYISEETVMREEPKADSRAIVTLPFNTKIALFDTGVSGWYYITYANESGYVSADFISKDQIEIVNDVPIRKFVRYGHINTHGGVLPTTSLAYITGGKWETLKKSLPNDLYVKVTRTCTTMDITWYEIYDETGSECYGWIDATFIDLDDAG